MQSEAQYNNTRPPQSPRNRRLNMDNEHEIILNQSNIPYNPLRENIVSEVKKYIGYVYADDTHFGDCLTIDKRTLEVSHGRFRTGDVRDPNLAYYDMHDLITTGKSAFTFDPYHPGIDVVMLDFFPIEVLNHFLESADKAVQDFTEKRGVVDETAIGFLVDTFDVEVYVPSEIEVSETTDEDYLDEDFLDAVQFIEVPLKNYIRVRTGKVSLNKRKLLILGLSHYGLSHYNEEII